MKNQIEKDIEATIRLLRFMTWSEGTTYLSVFDSGSFEEGTITSYLERSGLTVENKKFHTPEEFKDALMSLADPHKMGQDTLLSMYKKRKWNHE